MTQFRHPILLVLWLTVTAFPAYGGPPFVTDDPDPVDEGHYEVNIAAIGLAQKAGLTSPAPMIDANWGALPDTQIHAGFGVAYAEKAGAVHVGYGDTEFGVKYRFNHQDEDGWQPEVAFYPILNFPTGNAARGLGAGHPQLLLPIWVEKDWGDWSVYGGGGFSDNQHGEDRNNWFAGWVLLRKVSEHLQIGGEIYRQTSVAIGQPVNNAFNLGGTCDLSETGHILFSAGRGLSHAATEDRYSFYLGYRITL